MSAQIQDLHDIPPRPVEGLAAWRGEELAAKLRELGIDETAL